jgi:cobalt-zinc-cadmium efflux system outer membrane protein
MIIKNRKWMGLCAWLLISPVPAAPAQPDTVPALGSWVSQVLADHPAMLAADASLDAARARAIAAEQPLYNPELEFEYENSDTETRAGGISQAIDWADKRGARTGIAAYELDTAEAGRAVVRQLLAAEILSTLADHATAVAQQELGEQRSVLMERFGGLAERRRQAGDLAQVELDLATLAVAEARFQQAAVTIAKIQTLQALIAVAGGNAGQRPALPAVLPELELQQLDRQALLQSLPALRKSMARVAAARATVKLRSRERRPDPTVTLRAGKEESDTLTGVNVSIPLFVRNTLRAEVDAASAELLQAESDANDLHRRSMAELEAAGLTYQLSRSAWQVWERSGAVSLGEQIKLLQRLWQAGEINTTDYLVQLKQALDTRASAIEQRGRMQQAWIDWLLASGQVENWLQTGDISNEVIE